MASRDSFSSSVFARLTSVTNRRTLGETTLFFSVAINGDPKTKNVAVANWILAQTTHVVGSISNFAWR